jgi:hypothetical protein
MTGVRISRIGGLPAWLDNKPWSGDPVVIALIKLVHARICQITSVLGDCVSIVMLYSDYQVRYRVDKDNFFNVSHYIGYISEYDYECGYVHGPVMEICNLGIIPYDDLPTHFHSNQYIAGNPVLMLVSYPNISFGNEYIFRSIIEAKECITFGSDQCAIRLTDRAFRPLDEWKQLAKRYSDHKDFRVGSLFYRWFYQTLSHCLAEPPINNEYETRLVMISCGRIHINDPRYLQSLHMISFSTQDFYEILSINDQAVPNSNPLLLSIVKQLLQINPINNTV